MKNPIARILISLIALWILSSLVLKILYGNFSLFIFIPLAATVGPIMALQFPFPITFKIYLSLSFFLSFVAITIGFRNRLHIWGQLLCIAGAIVWVITGFIGLGTGT